MWLGLAHGVGALFRGIGRGAKGLDPAHRKDGLALLLLGLALVVAVGTYSDLKGPVGDLVQILVTGTFGRLDLLVPVLIGIVVLRLMRHPEQNDANGRIVIGLSTLVVGVLGLVHIGCGSPGRGQGAEAIRNAGGLIGWGASAPLVFTVGRPLAVALLGLLTFFGLLVVTATPVAAIPQRLRELGMWLRLLEAPEPEGDDVALGSSSSRTSRPSGPSWSRSRAGSVRSAPRSPGSPGRTSPRSSGSTPSMWPPQRRPIWTARSCTGCSPRRSSRG